MNQPPVKRMLRWFDKKPDGTLAGETELRGVNLADLQREFGVDPSDPMYDCWAISEQHRSFVEGNIGATIDLDQFDYFVEADAQ